MSETAAETGMVGYMAMPSSFSYRALFIAGRPKHQKYDAFWRKHPPMDKVHRAKIFSPFDALAGFNECIQSKNTVYCEKRTLSEGEMDELNKTLSYLCSLTYNSRASRINRPVVTIEFFVLCNDSQNEWYEKGGRYETVTGTVSKVDALIAKTMTIDERVIPLADISVISLRHDRTDEDINPYDEAINPYDEER